MMPSILFKDIRKSALDLWLMETNRVRSNDSDDYNESFECSWQKGFGVARDPAEHYSIFCSIGDWNTNITDYLDDPRFDDLNILNEEDKDVLFRQYTRILLAASEILTDFQDTLSTFRAGRFLKTGELNREKEASRIELDSRTSPGATQNIFTFINNICKHKVNNIHICNHHLGLDFADTQTRSSLQTIIRIDNVELFIPRNPNDTPTRLPTRIEIPKLSFIIETIVNSYKIVDDKFKCDPVKFSTFCNLYKGTSIRQVP